MTRNAAETADQAVAQAPGDHRPHAVAARAHARLGHATQAASAFEKMLATFDARRGTTGENLASLNAAASWFEKEKRPGDAAASLRHAAALKDLSPTIRVTLRVRALEQAALSGDRARAKDDLARLREAHRAALGTSLTPAQRDLLNVAENAIRRFEGLQ